MSKQEKRTFDYAAIIAKTTPMMKQYLETKQQYPEQILFYRLGDFYEMFFEDALLVVRELELTLTGKDCGLEERAPMCGVPYHAAEMYIEKLVAKGYKVAVCEQVEDPKQTKGLVKREVVRIVTAGTYTESHFLQSDKNHYLTCLCQYQDAYGIATCDVSTGELLVTQTDQAQLVADELFKLSPAELLLYGETDEKALRLGALQQLTTVQLTRLEEKANDMRGLEQLIKQQLHLFSLDAVGLRAADAMTAAVGLILQYITETAKHSAEHITELRVYAIGDYMMLDNSTRRNLELCETMHEKSKRGSLLWVLDKTRTAMGARSLRRSLEQPLVQVDRINARLDALSVLTDAMIDMEEIREYLQSIYDLERLMGRIAYETANPKDLQAFSASLQLLPAIRTVLQPLPSTLLHELYEQIDEMTDLRTLIDSAIDDEAPLTIREGRIFRQGYDERIDTLKQAATEGKDWLSALEEEERNKTGIRNLKIKYNKVFGFYFEVTNSYRQLVPDYFIRKQTLVNAERYTTERLKELEHIVLGSNEKLVALEYETYVELRRDIARHVKRIKQTAVAIGSLDMLCSLANVAYHRGYVRPVVDDSETLSIIEGRHPVVEQMTGSHSFIPNDICLGEADQRIAVITGPNMAGKSTYMRQTALIVLMAQIGSFVPAAKAHIGVVDRIFTRVGASDELAFGRSTFMVEMTEVANILHNATARSLLILDEIGRGTSTFDGLSIAWAVIEYIADAARLGAKTLFATHYHELTELEGKIPGVRNFCITVKEEADGIIFLRKIIPGGADKSYGIAVAKLAGVPERVILRAQELVEKLEQADIAAGVKDIAARTQALSDSQVNRMRAEQQAELHERKVQEEVVAALRDLTVEQLTPIEAMLTLSKLQTLVKQAD